MDDALRGETSIKRVIVFRRAGNELHIEEGRDVWWHRDWKRCALVLPRPWQRAPALHSLHDWFDRKPKDPDTRRADIRRSIPPLNSLDLRDACLLVHADVGWVTGHS